MARVQQQEHQREQDLHSLLRILKEANIDTTSIHGMDQATSALLEAWTKREKGQETVTESTQVNKLEVMNDWIFLTIERSS